MIFFNGASGGLGHHLKPILDDLNLPSTPLLSRLENPMDLENELNKVTLSKGTTVTFVPMAALVSVPLCEQNPDQAKKINVTLTLKAVQIFLAWAKKNQLHPRLFYVSTGHIYAKKEEGKRIKESDPTDPKSVYAQTKHEAEKELLALCQTEKVSDLIIGRVFGLVGIHQPPHYVLPGMVKRVVEKNFKNIPGLSYSRDYLDSRDVCRNIGLLLQKSWSSLPLPVHHIVNICSGKSVTIKDVLFTIVEAFAVNKKEVEESISEAPGRPTDNRWIVGDPTLLESLTQKPAQEIPLIQTVQDGFSSTVRT